MKSHSILFIILISISSALTACGKCKFDLMNWGDSCAGGSSSSVQSSKAPAPTPAPTPVSVLISATIPENLTLGNSVKFTAAATYPDNSIVDVSADVTWSATAGELTFSANGNATTALDGTTQVQADFMGLTSNQLPVTINKNVIGMISAPGGVADYCQYVGTPNSPDCVNDTGAHLRDMDVSVDRKTVYVTGAASPDLYYCPATMLFSSAQFLTMSTLCGVGYSSPLAVISAVRVHPTKDLVYILDATTILACPINSDASVTTCLVARMGGVEQTGITFSLDGNRAYIATYGTTAELLVCDVQTNGALNNCINAGTGLLGVSSVVFHRATNTALLTDTINGRIRSCVVNTDGTLSGCVIAATPALVVDLRFNGNQEFLWAGDSSGKATRFDVDSSGVLTNPTVSNLTSMGAGQKLFIF